MRIQSLIFPTLFLLTLACGTHDIIDPDPSGCTGFAGCAEPITVDFTATIWHAQDDVAIEGAELTCVGEDTARATINAEGVMSFTLETMIQTGDYEECDSVTIHVPSSDSLIPQTLRLDNANGATIQMRYGDD